MILEFLLWVADDTMNVDSLSVPVNVIEWVNSWISKFSYSCDMFLQRRNLSVLWWKHAVRLPSVALSPPHFQPQLLSLAIYCYPHILLSFLPVLCFWAKSAAICHNLICLINTGPVMFPTFCNLCIIMCLKPGNVFWELYNAHTSQV